MNLISGLLLLGAVIAAAVGFGELELGQPTGDTLWKFLFVFSLLFSASFLPWGAIVGGPTIRGRSE